MLRLRQRLRKLEQSPMLQQPPDQVGPAIQAIDLALRQISDEDLASLRAAVRDQGTGRPFSPRELEAITAFETALAIAKNVELQI